MTALSGARCLWAEIIPSNTFLRGFLMSKLHLSLLCLATAGLMLAGCGDSEKKVTGPETEVGTEQSYNEVSSPPVCLHWMRQFAWLN